MGSREGDLVDGGEAQLARVVAAFGVGEPARVRLGQHLARGQDVRRCGQNARGSRRMLARPNAQSSWVQPIGIYTQFEPYRFTSSAHRRLGLRFRTWLPFV